MSADRAHALWLQVASWTREAACLGGDQREYREAEGDPALKAVRHRAHQEALTGATLGALKPASVVIMNPTHLATALKYSEEGDSAPAVLAQGR